MHFHWRGSEHFIDGQHFVAELHLVHRSTTDPNQFAVIGYLFKVTESALHHLRTQCGLVISYCSVLFCFVLFEYS